MKINVTIEFTEGILAGNPSNPEVYTRFIASQTTPENREEEVAALQPAETGVSVFPHDEKGRPHLWDYHVRAFCKEACVAITGKSLSAYRTKIDRWLFVEDRKLYFWRDGKIMAKEDGDFERIVRAMTMQGPRTTPKRSQTINAGAQLKFTVTVLPLGEPEITADMLKSWFEYGALSGMGEWRTGSKGRFKLVEFDVVEPAKARPSEAKRSKAAGKA